MRVLELSKGKLNLYETSKEMPIDLYEKFNKYLIQDLGIGSDMNDVAKHFSQLYKFMSEGMAQQAATESYNLYQNIFLMLNEINIEHISFCCWIHSINDEPLTDYSETNLRTLCPQLGAMGLTQGHISEILEDLKKKLTGN